jgi:hypothetical protein
MVYDVGARHAVPVGAFVGRVSFVMLKTLGNRDSGSSSSRMPD